MRSALSTALVVIGLALLSLTPASPRFLRDLGILSIYSFRAIDYGVDRGASALMAGGGVEESLAPIETLRERLTEWDDVLLDGLIASSPGEQTRIARVVELSTDGTRLLVDAGPHVTIAPGSPVLAGDVVIGRVAYERDGVAVVVTPFDPESRVAGYCSDDRGRPIRFVMVGEGLDSIGATVTYPEVAVGLISGAEVLAPDVSDLLPDSIRLFPAGARLGRLAIDSERTTLSGEPRFRVVPILNPRSLDAVAVRVLPRDSVDPDLPLDGFVSEPARRLNGGMLTPWRDGFGMTGVDAEETSAVTLGGFLVGIVERELLGAALVRGIGDGPDHRVVLVVGEGRPYPLQVQSIGRRKEGARFAVVRSTLRPAAGDWIVSGGRGRHVPRGIPLGVVVASGRGGFEIQRYWSPRQPEVLHRARFPSDPWNDR